MKTTTALISLASLTSLALGAPHLAPRGDCKQCEMDGHKLWGMVHAEPSGEGTCNVLLHIGQNKILDMSTDTPVLTWGFTGSSGDNIIASATQDDGILGTQYTAHAKDTYGGDLYIGMQQVSTDFYGFTAQYEHNGQRDEYTTDNCNRREVGEGEWGVQCTITC